jgi:NADPH2:quinone reductase
MNVIEVTEVGGPEVMKLVERPTPAPAARQMLVEADAIGVNFIDIYRREGRYPLPLPGTPGEEGSGRVLAVGPETTEFKPGDRVAWTTVLGSYGSHVIVPIEKAIHVPDAIGMDVAAAALVQGMTAHYLVHDSYVVKPGDTLLVHAAAGGVGSLLVQMIKAKGGRVIGTVSSAEKEQRARGFGADEIIRYDDFGKRVRELTDGKGVDAVYDSVGAATFDESLTCVRKRGTLVVFGGASGAVPPFDIMKLAWGGSLTLTRPYLEHFRATKDEFRWRANEVFRDVIAGKLEVTIGGKYSLANAADAHRDLKSRRTMGKLLLMPRGV